MSTWTTNARGVSAYVGCERPGPTRSDCSNATGGLCGPGEHDGARWLRRGCLGARWWQEPGAEPPPNRARRGMGGLQAGVHSSPQADLPRIGNIVPNFKIGPLPDVTPSPAPSSGASPSAQASPSASPSASAQPSSRSRRCHCAASMARTTFRGAERSRSGRRHSCVRQRAHPRSPRRSATHLAPRPRPRRHPVWHTRTPRRRRYSRGRRM